MQIYCRHAIGIADSFDIKLVAVADLKHPRR
jgi:hypothetical protein